MREILFRGKTDKGEWVVGYYGEFHNRPTVNEPNSHQIFEPKENAVPFGSYIGGLWHKVIPETVGQYTGLTDKNGKKIFEGDIVKFGDIIGVINYNCGCFCVKTNKPDWKNRNNPAIDIILNEYPNEIEVIGNIHDNPELLKGGEG